MAEKFPAEWEHWLEGNCGFYVKLPLEDRAELKRKMMVFLGEKHFEGCRGLAITDEVRVTIAAHACLLLLHRRAEFYPHLVTILVYPSTFVVEHIDVGEYGLEMREVVENAGESWDRGNVIVAWDIAKHGALDPQDGLNVLLHEFAHSLDSENGVADGAPPMPRAERSEWARVMHEEFEKLQADVAADNETLLDEYGSEDPAEFFAVCTETFFERGHEMRQQHPELYAVMTRFYKQDPAGWA